MIPTDSGRSSAGRMGSTQPCSQAWSVMYFSTAPIVTVPWPDCSMTHVAQPILRADAAADLRKGVGRLSQLPRLAQPPLGRQLQPVRDVVVQRTMRLAEWHAALAAPARLDGSLRIGEVAVDLAEVRAPLLGRTLCRHRPPDFDELQHLLRHRTSSRQRSADTVMPTSHIHLREPARNEKPRNHPLYHIS